MATITFNENIVLEVYGSEQEERETERLRSGEKADNVEIVPHASGELDLKLEDGRVLRRVPPCAVTII